MLFTVVGDLAPILKTENCIQQYAGEVLQTSVSYLVIGALGMEEVKDEFLFDGVASHAAAPRDPGYVTGI